MEERNTKSSPGEPAFPRPGANPGIPLTEKGEEIRRTLFLAGAVLYDLASAQAQAKIDLDEHIRRNAIILPGTPQQSHPVARFPTPTGTRWRDVFMKFVDGETVRIQAGDVAGTYLYSDLGMRNKRNGKPTRQWTLLRAIADGHGQIDWRSSLADRKNKKRMEILSTHLRVFSNLDEKPFEYLREAKGWRAKFRIEPD